MKTKDLLINYYIKQKKKAKFTMEISALESSIDILKDQCSEVLDNNREQMLKKKQSILVEKTILVNELNEDIAAIQCYLDSLEGDEKRLLEYKFSKKMRHDEIEEQLNISRSTIYRKQERLLKDLEEYLA